MGLDGGGRVSVEGPIRPKMAPIGPQGAQEVLHDRCRYPKMSQYSFHMPPRAFKTTPARFQVPFDLSKEASKRPKPFKPLCGSMCSAFPPFRFRWALQASRWPQDGPTDPQKRPKRTPKWPPEQPRVLQKPPKRTPKHFFEASEMTMGMTDHPRLEPWDPRQPKEAPRPSQKEPQDGPDTP
jgi:hypothetical protein